MIIDDEHRFAFVHNPKCGGTSVRNQLHHLDSYAGKFGNAADGSGVSHKRRHPQLGLIAYTHIPLAFVETHFPEEYSKLIEYETFVLVRDPYSRFSSAVFQRLAEFGQIPRSEITPKRALQEAERVAKWLERRSEFCDIEYIHFAQQVSFVDVGEQRVSNHAFAIEDVDHFATAVQQATGVRFDVTVRDNANFVLPPEAASLKRVLKPLYRRLTTWKFRQRLLSLSRSHNLQDPSPHYATLLQDPSVRAFVESYYSDDFQLYNEARGRTLPDV
jgi:hypothetical protein